MQYGKKEGAGKGKGMPNGGRRNVNKEPCKEEGGEGFSKGGGKGKGFNRFTPKY